MKQGCKQLKAYGLCILIATITGCGMLHTRKKDETSVQKVKRVAVVSFAVMQPASAEIGVDVLSGKLKGDRGGSAFNQTSSHIDTMYVDLNKHLKENLNWSVMNPKSMVKHPGYVQAYESTMKGFQNKMPVPSGHNQFLVEKVMDFDSARILDVKGRDQLIDALKVDAILAAKVNVSLTGTTVMGIGSRYPQANLSFFLYKKGQEEPIWFEGQIAGEQANQSVGKTGFIDESLLAKLSLESARTAFEKIGVEPKEE